MKENIDIMLRAFIFYLLSILISVSVNAQSPKLSVGIHMGTSILQSSFAFAGTFEASRVMFYASPGIILRHQNHQLILGSTWMGFNGFGGLSPFPVGGEIHYRYAIYSLQNVYNFFAVGNVRHQQFFRTFSTGTLPISNAYQPDVLSGRAHYLYQGQVGVGIEQKWSEKRLSSAVTIGYGCTLQDVVTLANGVNAQNLFWHPFIQAEINFWIKHS